jgi:hypothetical protein
MPIYSGGGRRGNEPGPHYGAGPGGSYGYSLPVPSTSPRPVVDPEAEQCAVQRAACFADKWDAYLSARSKELGQQAIHVLLHNASPSNLLKAAVLFHSPSNDPEWITTGWYFVKPLETLRTNIVTLNPNLYFYGCGPNQTTWDGSGQQGSVMASLVRDRFACVLGQRAEGRDECKMTMLHRVAPNLGEFKMTFNPPAQVRTVPPVTSGSGKKELLRFAAGLLLGTAAVAATALAVDDDLRSKTKKIFE